MKKCNCCGKEHHAIPEDARVLKEDELTGFYFECECGSTITLFLEMEKVEEGKK